MKGTCPVSRSAVTTLPARHRDGARRRPLQGGGREQLTRGSGFKGARAEPDAAHGQRCAVLERD